MSSIGGDSQTGSSRISANQMENIKVAVRLRPFTEKEKQNGSRRIVDIEKNTVVLYNPRPTDTNFKRFTFDYSYWSHDGFARDQDGRNVPDLQQANCAKYVSQEKVFEDLGVFLLDNALRGYNSALLAYGQTGSGKSYTVSGYGQNEGILPRFARALFEELEKRVEADFEPAGGPDSTDAASASSASASEGSLKTSRYKVLFCMIEIYNEVVRDLLAKTNQNDRNKGLKIREHPKRGFFVENLTSLQCNDKNEIEQRIQEGHLNKSIAATSMNESSSRGHTIYEFRIKQYQVRQNSNDETLTTSVVQLVDLAGSERMAVHQQPALGEANQMTLTSSNSNSNSMRSNSPKPSLDRHSIRNSRAKLPSASSMSSTATSVAARQSRSSVRKPNTSHSILHENQKRFKESVSINQSLTALGKCIQILSQYSLDSAIQSRKPPPKIPYRDSALTKLLNRCMLNGNSKVVIIANLSPADSNYDDTLSTLRFADRAKQIKTHAIINRMNSREIIDNEDLEKREAQSRDQLMSDTYDYAVPVAEVNAAAKEMGIRVEFGMKILSGEERLPDHISMGSSQGSDTPDGFSSSSMSERAESSDLNMQEIEDTVIRLNRIDNAELPPALYIKVRLEEPQLDFYWSKEKFQARRYKMLEMYEAWETGGKPSLVEYLIDQSRLEGSYLIDPFIDDPNTTPVLIGHAQITLQSVSQLADSDQTYDIIDLDDELAGSIKIQIVPCHPEPIDNGLDGGQIYTPFSEDELLKQVLLSPKDLIDKKLVFMIKILSCVGLPDKYINVYCQYSLDSSKANIRTKMTREEGNDDEESTSELVFNHTHYICLERVDKEICDFLEHGFLTVQVIGQYKAGSVKGKPLTVVSTIIDSINKYKLKLSQQGSSYSGTNFASSSYYNSDSALSNRAFNATNSNSGASSDVSTSATVNLFDQQNDEDDPENSIDGLSQENIIDMILTKRKLDRAENQLHYLKRTVNIAEHYNKKHIPVKTVKKLLNSYGHQLDSGSLEEMAADVPVRGRGSNSKNSTCMVQ